MKHDPSIHELLKDEEFTGLVSVFLRGHQSYNPLKRNDKDVICQLGRELASVEEQP